MAAFTPLLDLLGNVPDPRRGEGQLYKLPHVLLFSILAVVTGGNSYRGIETFIDSHRKQLNAAFGLKWCRAPAYTSIRYILKGLDPATVETVFRHHAALLEAARATPGQGSIALDGKTLRGSFDHFHDRAAAQVLSAFATDTALVLAHVDIAEKSNEIPAAQALLAELGVQDDKFVTLDALHCQKNTSRSPNRPTCNCSPPLAGPSASAAVALCVAALKIMIDAVTGDSIEASRAARTRPFQADRRREG
jgi:predicted transposase YbfD/YdcC